MSRISVPDPQSIDANAQPLLDAVHKQLGTVPNLFKVLAHSPAALEGFLGLNGALGKGRLDAALRERIALAVAEANGCGYCLSAHAYLGKNRARLSDGEIEAARDGRSGEARADAAVGFARKVLDRRGAVSDADIAAVRAAGFQDGEIVEIVAVVAVNVLTNYVNVVADTPIDFPVLALRRAA